MCRTKSRELLQPTVPNKRKKPKHTMAMYLHRQRQRYTGDGNQIDRQMMRMRMGGEPCGTLAERGIYWAGIAP